MTKLLTCPHCAGEGDLAMKKILSPIGHYFKGAVVCRDCGARVDAVSVKSLGDAKRKVVNAWNRRTNDGD